MELGCPSRGDNNLIQELRKKGGKEDKNRYSQKGWRTMSLKPRASVGELIRKMWIGERPLGVLGQTRKVGGQRICGKGNEIQGW